MIHSEVVALDKAAKARGVFQRGRYAGPLAAQQAVVQRQERGATPMRELLAYHRRTKSNW